MLNNRYRENIEMPVKELDTVFIITGGGAVYYLGPHKEMKTALSMKLKNNIVINHMDREIEIIGWDKETKTFAYTISEE